MCPARERPKPEPVKLFCGLIGSEASITEATRLLVEEFGPVDHAAPMVPFNFTDYYEAEMGTGLMRQWISFKTLKERAYLPRAKHAAVHIEGVLSEAGRRTANIDPGYVDNAQVVLATGKNFSHRIYIGMGYYGEVTLVHIGGRFQPVDWTYPDYRGRAAAAFFRSVRSTYRNQVSDCIAS